MKGRGYSENGLLLSSLPYFVAAAANCDRLFASHLLVKRVGLTWGRRTLGLVGLGIAAPCAVAVMFTHQWLAVLILLSICYRGITFQQPDMFALCLDIGGEFAGAMVGAMNTASQIGSFGSSVVFGYLVSRFGSYDLPFIPMAAFLLIGCCLWLEVDPCKKSTSEAPVATTANHDRGTYNIASNPEIAANWVIPLLVIPTIEFPYGLFHGHSTFHPLL